MLLSVVRSLHTNFLGRRFYHVAVSSVSITGGTVNTGYWLMLTHDYGYKYA